MNYITSIHYLGANLGVNFDEIQACEGEKSLHAQVLCMLEKWKMKQGSKATVMELIEALQLSGISESCYKKTVLDYFKKQDPDSK